jgi:hypothetical protein
MPMLPLILSSDSHVFEPPDLWQTRIDAAFRDRAPRIERIDGADQIVVEADQILSGIGLISNAGARFEAPETISAPGLMQCCLPRADLGLGYHRFGLTMLQRARRARLAHCRLRRRSSSSIVTRRATVMAR